MNTYDSEDPCKDAFDRWLPDCPRLERMRQLEWALVRRNAKLENGGVEAEAAASDA